MTAHISLTDAKAWVESTKYGAGFAALDADLESQISADVLGQLSQAFNVTAWADSSSTPLLVRRVISMYYVAWVYDRTTSGDQLEATNAYAILLRQNADMLIAGIISGSVDLPDIPDGTDLGTGLPGYYPTDESSLLTPNADDWSLGGPVFSMGRQW